MGDHRNSQEEQGRQDGPGERGTQKELSVRDKRRKAWQNIVDNNRNRRLHVDPDVDISRLADEMNDMEFEE